MAGASQTPEACVAGTSGGRVESEPKEKCAGVIVPALSGAFGGTGPNNASTREGGCLTDISTSKKQMPIMPFLGFGGLLQLLHHLD